ncbi:MAG: hypothetical protein K0R03_1271 [Moraxellaceae bacterium]|nr:hypothetical protein [Moraxellaceae bacterium]
MKILTGVCALLLAGAASAYTPRDGDIIFHTSRSAQSIAVQKATGSRYSHMGLIFLRGGKPFVLEAVQPVKYTPLAQWQARGEGGRYVIKRLAAPLSAADLQQLRREGEKFLGRPYDLTFEWSDGRIYCSELVWKAYFRATGLQVGATQQLRDFHLDDPAVKRKMQERYSQRVPLNEPVIAPVAVFESPLLTMVEQR